MLRDEGITSGGNLIVLTDGDENDNAVQHITTIGSQVQAQGVSNVTLGSQLQANGVSKCHHR